MIELQYLEQKKADLLKDLEQLKANANALSGAIQLVDHLIAVAKQKVANLEAQVKADVLALTDKVESKVESVLENKNGKES